MSLKSIVNIAKVCLWRKNTITWTVISVLVSAVTWTGIGAEWPLHLKLTWLTVFLLIAVIVCILSGTFELYSKAYHPILVRDVREGSHFYSGTLLVILERSDVVDIGDILTLFVRIGNLDEPVCLLEVVAFTTPEKCVQSAIITPLTNVTLSEYLTDRTRIAKLYAKFGVSNKHLPNHQQSD